MTASVTLESTVAPSDQVMVQTVGDEAILLDLASEQYFGLDPVGTRMWELIGELGQLRGVHTRLCEEFDADAERIQEDLLALMQELADAGLVTVT